MFYNKLLKILHNYFKNGYKVKTNCTNFRFRRNANTAT